MSEGRESHETALKPTFKLKVLADGDIRISLQRKSVLVNNESLCRYGWNSIADACRLLDKRVKGIYS